MPQEKTRRLGIFGGSFNPIHNGHLHAIRAFIDELNLDRALIVPTAVSFYKETDATHFRHRFEMCRLALAGFSKPVGVSAIELLSPQGMPTYRLIAEITKHYPDSNKFLLIGGDIYHRLPIWQNVEAILAGATVCVLDRGIDAQDALINETTQKLKSLGGDVVFLKADTLPISSTDIRKTIAAGSIHEEALPESVADYIIRHRLYSD